MQFGKKSPRIRKIFETVGTDPYLWTSLTRHFELAVCIERDIEKETVHHLKCMPYHGERQHTQDKKHLRHSLLRSLCICCFKCKISMALHRMYCIYTSASLASFWFLPSSVGHQKRGETIAETCLKRRTYLKPGHVRNALNYISQYRSLKFILLLCVKCFLTKQNAECKGAAQTGKIVCERDDSQCRPDVVYQSGGRTAIET